MQKKFVYLVLFLILIILSGDCAVLGSRPCFIFEQEYLFNNNLYSLSNLLEERYIPREYGKKALIDFYSGKKYIFGSEDIQIGYLETEEEQIAINPDTVLLLSNKQREGKEYVVNLRSMEQKLSG